jgi:hypothetical protein
MKKTKPLYLSLLVSVTLLMQFAFPTQVLAAPLTQDALNMRVGEQERLTKVMNPANDIEEFRSELYDYFTELENAMRLVNEIPAIRQKLSESGFQTLPMLAATKQKLAELNPAELSALRALYAGFPGWRDGPRTMNSLLKPRFRDMLELKVAARKSAGGIETALVADDCAAGITADVTNTDISLATTAVIAAEAVMEALPTDGLTILARVIPVAAVATFKGLLLTAQTFKNIKDDCNAASFEAAIQQQITDNTNTIVNNDNSNTSAIISNDNANATNIIANDNSNKTAIINNDNANTTTIIDNDNANMIAIITNDNANKNELRDLIRRTQIEADLAEADNATPVALYLTPNANGGHLDLVQTIVTQTLASIQAAGGSIGNAQTFLDRANADKAVGRFKSAYGNYRKAYKAAAN